jgi:hypothetical protein
MAIHPAGTHLAAVTNSEHDEHGGLDMYSRHRLDVYELPAMNLLATLDLLSDSLSGSRATRLSLSGLCFTDAGTLLVADYENDHVQHLTLGGLNIASYTVCDPICVASRGDIMAIGTNGGVYVCALKSGAMQSLNSNCNIQAIAFADKDTLAVANYTKRTVSLYTLTGKLIKHLARAIYSYGLAMCADGCLLASDYILKRIRVFAPDGTELTTSPLATHIFQTHPRSIALSGERVYALEYNSSIVPIFK